MPADLQLKAVLTVESTNNCSLNGSVNKRIKFNGIQFSVIIMNNFKKSPNKCVKIMDSMDLKAHNFRK